MRRAQHIALGWLFLSRCLRRNEASEYYFYCEFSEFLSLLHPVLKSVAAVVSSFAVAVGMFMAIEGVGSVLHPWPEDFAGTMEQIKRQVETYPAWVLALLGGGGYGLTMLLCTFIATRFGHLRHRLHGYGIALFLFAMVVFNLTQLPFPRWYWALMFTVLPAAAFVGTRLGAPQGNPTAS